MADYSARDRYINCTLAGEHDASLDRGDAYREFFGDRHYTFDHKGIHFIVLDNVSDPAGAIGAAQLMAVLALAGCAMIRAAHQTQAERVIRLTAKKFEYHPSEITVKRGAPVVLELTSLKPLARCRKVAPALVLYVPDGFAGALFRDYATVEFDVDDALVQAGFPLPDTDSHRATQEDFPMIIEKTRQATVAALGTGADAP